MDQINIDLSKYRIERAFETIDDAVYAIADKRYTMAVNRLYYACFYAALALLSLDGETAKTHQGVKQMIGKNYFLTNKIDRLYASIYSRLFNARISGDYDEFQEYDDDTVQLYLQNAKDFVNKVAEFLKEQQA